MRIVSTILVSSLLLQSCYFPSGKSRSVASKANVEGLISQFESFKVKAMGSEVASNCKPEDIERDFQNLMKSLKKDSCELSEYKIDRESFVNKTCPKQKKDGYFDVIVKEIVGIEKQKKQYPVYRLDNDPVFQKYYSEAKLYHQKTFELFRSQTLPNELASNILSSYIENVLLPIRDIIIIKQNYLAEGESAKKYLNQLFPIISEDQLRSFSVEELGMITQGPNPTSNPFYIEPKNLEKQSDFMLLKFSESDILRRDVLTLLKAPTSKNYVVALKWMTLHMMMSQVYIYNTILGSKAPVDVPNSCQNQFNGSLPSQFQFKFEEGMGEQFLENILASHGLTFKQDDTSYLDYYIDNVSKDPTKDGYSGLVPFENYKNAKRSQGTLNSGALEAQFDDVAHYQSVVNFKAPEALNVFKGVKTKSSRAYKSKHEIIYEGQEEFQKMLKGFEFDEIAEIKLKDGSMKQIYPGKQNLSQYLLDVMKSNGIEDYTQLLSPKMKKKFEGKKVLIDFPSMYSSPIWRDWSLKLLADLFHQNKDLPLSSELHRTVLDACRASGAERNATIKDVCFRGNRVENLANLLSEFRGNERYIPTRRLEELKFQELYPFLTNVWRNVRDMTSLLSEAKPFELNFLVDQMSANNPWARLKLSYLVLIDQLEYQKDGNSPVYEFNGLWFNVNEKAQCEENYLDTKYEKVKKAGRVLGLDRQLNYNFAGKFLSKSEKDIIWKQIVDDFEHRNAQLFSAKSSGKDYYQVAESVSLKTILTKQDALSTSVKLSDKSKNEIEKISSNLDGKLGAFFIGLYKLKGKIEDQKKYFEEFSKVNGIDNTFNLKLAFLALDESYKKPIYKDLLKEAALMRKIQINTQLSQFCALNPNDHKGFKNLFYQASKAQNEINQMAGLPGVPEEVLSKINEMSPDEFRDMWWGIGSAVLGISAVIVGGACTALSGGLCAPLGGAMAVAGLASVGIQVKLTSNELGRKYQADLDESEVKKMEDLGFANLGSSDEVHRSYGWAAFEALSIFPLIGVATRSATLGPKLVYVSTKSLLNKTGKVAFKAAAKTAAQEEEVRLAKYVLGIDSVSKNLGVDSKTISIAKTQIEKIKKLYVVGEIDFNTMVSKVGKIINPIKRLKLAALKTVKNEVGTVVVKESKEEINNRTAKVVADYFSHNPKSMLRVVSSYSGERLNKATKAMADLRGRKIFGAKIPVYRNVREWWIKMRNESLVNNASKILRIEKELQSLPNNPGVLEGFIRRNMEDLTDIFIDIPMRKRELPYIVQIQGMPDINFFKGQKFPILSLMSEGQTLKRVFGARSRLVYESYLKEARTQLKLSRNVKAETMYGAFKSFQYSVAHLASQKTEQESALLISKFEKVEDELVQKIYQQFKLKNASMDYSKFKTLVTRPTTLKEKAEAEVIWSNANAQDLFQTQNLKNLAHQAVAELSQYSNIDEFERLIGALKIITLNKNPAVLDIM